MSQDNLNDNFETRLALWTCTAGSLHLLGMVK